jgi:hypothetical protein
MRPRRKAHINKLKTKKHEVDGMIIRWATWVQTAVLGELRFISIRLKYRVLLLLFGFVMQSFVTNA